MKPGPQAIPALIECCGVGDRLKISQEGIGQQFLPVADVAVLDRIINVRNDRQAGLRQAECPARKHQRLWIGQGRVEINPPMFDRRVRQARLEHFLRDADRPLDVPVRPCLFDKKVVLADLDIQPQTTLIAYEEGLCPLLEQVVDGGFGLVPQIAAEQRQRGALHAAFALRFIDPGMNWQHPSSAICIQMTASAEQDHHFLGGGG